MDGACERVIGPLEEHQGFIPVEFHISEEQPTLIEKIERIHEVLSLDSITDTSGAHSSEPSDSDGAYAVNDPKMIGYNGSKSDLEAKFEEVHGKIDTISEDVQGKIDTISKDVQGKIDTISKDVQGKVDGVENKVDSLEEKVNSVQNELKELKDMMSKLVDALA